MMGEISQKIKIIPIEAPFLRIFAKYFLSKFKNFSPDFQKFLVIFPSQRNKFYFRRYLLEELDLEGIIPPLMKTPEEFFEDIYKILNVEDGIFLEKIERNFLLKEVINSLKVEFWKDLPFLRFISVGERLLKFFEELAKERITLEEVEEKAISEHYPERYVENELKIFKKIYQEYRKKLKKENFKDEIDKYNLIYEKFTPSLLKEYKYIFIAGLVGLTSLEEKIFRDILENLPSEFIVHSRKLKENFISLESPFYPHYKIFNLWKIDIEKVEVLDGEKKYNPVKFWIKSAETETQQSFYLKEILNKIKDRYSLPGICIVLPEESILYSITETLKTSGLKFNLSMGLPFKYSILYSFLEQLKEVIEKNWHWEDFFSFLRHPLIKNIKIGEESLTLLIYELQNYILKNQLNYFKFSDFEKNEKFEKIINILKFCIEKVSQEISFKEYIDGLIELLNRIISYSFENIDLNFSNIKEFMERLNSLRRLRLKEEAIGKGIKMLEFILEVLKYEKYNIIGDFRKGVQVIGILEARNLDFDCLILPSANEGVFPKYSEKDLFLNRELRKNLKLPYDKERENLYYYYFTQMTSGKKEVFISYVSNEKRDIRSRFVDFLIEEYGIKPEEKKFDFKRTTLEIPKREIKKEKKLEKFLFKKLEDTGLTPSSLKDYKECPYRFYLNYILEIEEKKEIVEEITPLVFGNIVHAALKNFYKYDFPKILNPEDSFEKAKEFLDKRLEETLKKNIAKYPKNIIFLNLEIYKKILEKFLQNEFERFRNGYKVWKLEEKLEHEIEVDGKTIKIYGYPDRIDIFEERYYLLDYKCSTSPPSQKDYKIGEDFKEFQLPLYALILSKKNFEKICGMAYYIINNKDSKLLEIVKNREEIPNYLESFEKEILLPTIRDIFEKDFEQTEKKENCKYCMYNYLCGVTNV